WVAAGTYPELINLETYVYLYGGFDVVDESWSDRDYQANPTILDGGGTGSVITCSGLGLATSAIDGFTIRNGKANYGGGIRCVVSSPLISHNTITSNAANGSGGGIYCDFSSSPLISDNIIELNTSNNRAAG